MQVKETKKEVKEFGKEFIRMLLLSLFSILFIVHVQSLTCSTTWLYYNATFKGCRCGSKLRHVVNCNEILKEVQVLSCHAMTYSEKYNTTIVGTSLLHCASRAHGDGVVLYKTVDNDPLKLNNVSCSKFNREGTHCERCIAYHSMPVYSYNLKCTVCELLF